jgi:hypothetical protein
MFRYAVPAASTAAFEEALQKALPEQFGRQPDLLFHAVRVKNVDHCGLEPTA